jgi:hypothetical protein
MKYIQRTMSIMILPEGESIFCETATTIAISDDAAGEFLKITQCNDESEKGEISLEQNEWPVVRAGIDMMFKEIEKHNQTK